MERQILSLEGVLITDRRIVLGSSVYPVANVTSVRATSIRGSLVPALLVLIVAILLVLVSRGLALTAFGCFIWMARTSYTTITHTLWLGAAGGEIDAFRTTDGRLAARVHTAITEALFGAQP